MSVEIVEEIQEPESDAEEQLRIRTVDGTGDERMYRCSLGPDMLGASYLIGYRQLSGPEGSRPHVTDAVREAAREHWSRSGYRVQGVDEIEFTGTVVQESGPMVLDDGEEIIKVVEVPEDLDVGLGHRLRVEGPDIEEGLVAADTEVLHP